MARPDLKFPGEVERVDSWKKKVYLSVLVQFGLSEIGMTAGQSSLKDG